MDGTLGSSAIKPDQIGIVNPLLIIGITPIFNSLIYPCFTKCGLLTPLQRIGAGGFLIGISFLISGVVELNLEVSQQQNIFERDCQSYPLDLTYYRTITVDVPSNSGYWIDATQFRQQFTLPGQYFLYARRTTRKMVVH